MRNSSSRKLTVKMFNCKSTPPIMMELKRCTALSNQHNLYGRCSKDAPRWQITHLTRFSALHDIFTCRRANSIEPNMRNEQKQQQQQEKCAPLAKRFRASFPLQSHGNFIETDHYRFMWHLIKMFTDWTVAEYFCSEWRPMFFVFV